MQIYEVKFYQCKVRKEMVGRKGKERSKDEIEERVDRKKEERKGWSEGVAQWVKRLQYTQAGRSSVQVPRTHIKPKNPRASAYNLSVEEASPWKSLVILPSVIRISELQVQ